MNSYVVVLGGLAIFTGAIIALGVRVGKLKQKEKESEGNEDYLDDLDDFN